MTGNDQLITGAFVMKIPYFSNHYHDSCRRKKLSEKISEQAFIFASVFTGSLSIQFDFFESLSPYIETLKPNLHYYYRTEDNRDSVQ